MDGDTGRCPHLSPGRVTEPLGSPQSQPNTVPASLWALSTNPQDPAANPSSHQGQEQEWSPGWDFSTSREKIQWEQQQIQEQMKM